MTPILDEGLDELAAQAHPLLPMRLAAGAGVSMIGAMMAPWPLMAGWYASLVAFEIWSWFATRPQFLGRPISIAQRANHFLNLIALSAAWFVMGALLWSAGGISGAICGVTVWLSLMAYGQAFAFQSPVGYLISGGLPAFGMLAFSAAFPLAGQDMLPIWLILAVAAGFGISGFHQMLVSRRTFMDAQAKLSKSEAGYRLVADNITDVITRHDLEGGMVYVSPSSERVLGYTPAQLVSNAAEYIDPADMPRVIEAVTEARRTCSPQTVDYRIHHRERGVVWVESSFAPVEGEDGSLVSTTRDITARKQLQHDLRAAAERAEQAAAAKADFLANMTHELRTPLTAIIGFSEVLQGSDSLADQDARHVRLIHDASATLLGVVNSVLDFSKLEAGGLEFDHRPFDPSALAISVMSLVHQQAASKGLGLTFEGPGADWSGQGVLGDGPRLGQVMLNFLGNAIKFTDAGDITVRLARRSSRQGQWLRMEVQDTGCGAPKEKLDQLFDRFTQADAGISRQYGGTGLGLAIAKRIVEGLGGQIGADSALGAGSTFWFEMTLPAAALAAEADAAAAPDFDRPLRLLLVEDNPVNRELICALLAPFDVEVTQACDGLQGLAAVRAQAFDIVLMDVQMPVMDGLTATRAIRALGIPQPPIVAMTANVLPEQVQRCREAGMDDHLGKPLNTEQLLACLSRWTAEAQTEDQALSA